jgi:hypothetical protein
MIVYGRLHHKNDKKNGLHYAFMINCNLYEYEGQVK